MLYRFVTALTRGQKQVLFLALDIAAAPVALVLSIKLGTFSSPDWTTLWPLALILAVCAGVLSWHLGLARLRLNAFEMPGVNRLAMTSLILGIMGSAFGYFFGLALPVKLYLIFSLLLTSLTVAWRVALRRITILIYRRGSERIRVLIYGAGQTGQQLAAALHHDREIQPLAFVDDNPGLQGLSISGLRVHPAAHLPDLIELERVDRIVLAMPSISQPALARIAHRLRPTGCEVHALPSFAQLVGKGELRRQVTPVSINDLLGRGGLERELPGVSHAYSGRRILITGAGGSIGSELCRQLIMCAPERLVLLDHSELALYEIDRELRELNARIKIKAVLGSVCDIEMVRDLLTGQRIDVVLHAAAYKHLPMVEQNALAGLTNNVLGTKTLADASRDAGVERFILVSSDKAVRPTNVMGASKRLAELVVQDLAYRSTKTRFSMVRFGNVLGSSGSVVPLFEEQIARGGPLTLTDRRVTRFFMTISEAVRLVLLAGSFARGGDVFVLDMGEPVLIEDLARKMIERAGYTVRDANHPEGEIAIDLTGLRPGEKLHEELLIAPDMLTTPHPKIMRAQETALSEFETATALKDLRRAIEARDETAARAVISRWVEPASGNKVDQGGLGKTTA